MDNNCKLEEKKISNNCTLNIYISNDEKNYIFEIDYLQGRFVSQKMFPNNFKGIADMEEAKNTYKTEYDIKEYFGII